MVPSAAGAEAVGAAGPPGTVGAADAGGSPATADAHQRVTLLMKELQRAREDAALVVLEGFHPLKHALRFGASVERIVTCDQGLLSDLARAHAPELAQEIARLAAVIPRSEFRRLGPYEPHTRVVSVAHRVDYRAAALLAGSAPAPLVLLDDPRHRGNVGAVIRVAAAAQAAGVLALGPEDPWNPVVVRGSAGLHFAVPVARLDELPATGRPLIALDPAGDRFRAAAVPDGAVLAFGSERRGLRPELLRRADARLALPMSPGVSSLNLATAVAAVLYSLRLLHPAP